MPIDIAKRFPITRPQQTLNTEKDEIHENQQSSA